MNDRNIETCIESIEASGNYKVLEVLDADKEVFNDYDDDFVGIGVFVDVETTGLDSVEDEIIELGMVKFEYGKKTGKIYRILDKFDAFQEPTKPISEEIEELTGISNEMVAGCNIDTEEVNAFISEANVVIAHNANFDRKFIEAKFSVFEDMPWACSLEDIDWKSEGFNARSLEFLAFKFGFVYSAHRADVDCLASIHLLSKKLPKSGNYAMSELLASARESKILIKAVKAPFEAKDTLKGRGYRWNVEEKVWWIIVDGEDSNVELEYLNESIYVQERFRPDSIPTKSISSLTRYSNREWD